MTCSLPHHRCNILGWKSASQNCNSRSQVSTIPCLQSLQNSMKYPATNWSSDRGACCYWESPPLERHSLERRRELSTCVTLGTNDRFMTTVTGLNEFSASWTQVKRCLTRPIYKLMWSNSLACVSFQPPTLHYREAWHQPANSWRHSLLHTACFSSASLLNAEVPTWEVRPPNCCCLCQSNEWRKL
jgi:hypothetical protein